MNGNIYVRPVNDYDKYREMPCYEIKYLEDDKYHVEWQENVLI
jgi:hypothetical protein